MPSIEIKKNKECDLEGLKVERTLCRFEKWSRNG